MRITDSTDPSETLAGGTAAVVQEVIVALAGPGAVARADQVEAVGALVDERRRVLVVQATGWGKSAVYWAATTALRRRGAGPTLVISPLLALMRDQVAAAERAGLRAATINSTNIDEWDAVLHDLHDDVLDVLLVSPERLANPRFAGRLAALIRRCGLLVVDEAHCISDWGFDFRPDYQRLSRLLLHLAPDTPILATTATANQRVTADVAAQLGAGTTVLRGPLARASLRLAVLPQLGPLDRYAWVADACTHLPGSGIVYALTVAETERLAGFLSAEGIEALAYHGQLDVDQRREVEDRLRDNHVKVVVATSALGMGYDKPDLAFVLHLGSPASPVAYYQQVGRAGRALDDAVAVLLPSAGDERIWEYFATSTIPDPDHAATVLAILDRGPAKLTELEAATGLRRGRLETLLKILAVDDAVHNGPDGWCATGHGWHFDTDKYGSLLAVRAAEADLMRRYAGGRGCLMAFLQEALGDATAGPCGRCSVCTGALPPPGAAPSPERRAAVRRYLRGQDCTIEPRKLWPSGLPGRKGKLAPVVSAGRALAFADDPAWADELVDRDDLSPALAEGVGALLARWRPAVDAVVPVPSRRRAGRVAALAAEASAQLGVPVLDLLALQGPAPPDQVASKARVQALLGSLSVTAASPPSVLLVDDTYRTGWTATVAAMLLAEHGAEQVHPLVLHQLP
ncbi:MAG: RecQ family ATP-dependent DNA helicase [Acidimicrobiia bacterium]